MSEKEFNRKESTKSVGQLYPVLLSKDGKVIDGFHRLEEDPDWRTQTLDYIDNEEKLILARTISNWHRRQVPEVEKVEWINGLARVYLGMGLKVRGKREGRGTVPNEITNKIVEVTGLSRPTVLRYLNDKFKQKERATVKTGPRVKASQVIETISRSQKHSTTSLVKRHEREVREKLLKDPDFQDEVIQAVGDRAGQPALAMDIVDQSSEEIMEGYKVKEDPQEAQAPLEAHDQTCPNCLCGQCLDRQKCQDLETVS